MVQIMRIFEMKSKLLNGIKRRVKHIKRLTRMQIFKQIQIEIIWFILYIISLSILLWCRIAFHIGVHCERKKNDSVNRKSYNKKNVKSVIRT